MNYYNNLQFDDFIYILSSLKTKNLIDFEPNQELMQGLSKILDDYIEE